MKLQLVRVDELCESFNVDRFPITFGRADDVDIHIDGILTSRRHCRIEHREGRVWLRDLQSTNGTLLNGNHVQRAELKPGDVFTVGTTSFRLSVSESQSAVTATTSSAYEQ